VVVLSGSVGVTAGSDSFILHEGSAILHPPMEFHSLHAALGSSPTVRIFTFCATSVPVYHKRIFSLSPKTREASEQILTLLKSAAEWQGIHLIGAAEGRERQLVEAARLMEILLLRLDEIKKAPEAVYETTGARNYAHALSVLESNLTRSLDTAELAALCHMSSSLLKKTFSKYAGMGVMEYFRTQKVLAAIPMLRGGQSVAETALHFGFSDAGYFSTVFRRITGHTPGYYRNR